MSDCNVPITKSLRTIVSFSWWVLVCLCKVIMKSIRGTLQIWLFFSDKSIRSHQSNLCLPNTFRLLFHGHSSDSLRQWQWVAGRSDMMHDPRQVCAGQGSPGRLKAPASASDDAADATWQKLEWSCGRDAEVELPSLCTEIQSKGGCLGVWGAFLP